MIWNVRLQPVKQNEEGWRPSLVLGTGSIRTGSSDNSLYVNLNKSFEFSENFAVPLQKGLPALLPTWIKYTGLEMLRSLPRKNTHYVSILMGLKFMKDLPRRLMTGNSRVYDGWKKISILYCEY